MKIHKTYGEETSKGEYAYADLENVGNADKIFQIKPVKYRGARRDYC